MADKASLGIGVIVMVFIIAILGIIFAGAIADAIFDNVTPQVVRNDSVDVTAQHDVQTPRDWLGNATSNLAATRIITVLNAQHENGTNMVRNTDYIINTTFGTITMLNSTTNVAWNSSNVTLWNYTYQQANYVNDGISRTILSAMVVIFFVVGVLLFVISQFTPFLDAFKK